jgi:hypothetical protein
MTTHAFVRMKTYADIVLNDGNSGRINRTAGTSCDETWSQAFLETYSWK